MKYLTVIPARGGSKGIPYKNIVKFNGKPLLEYTLETAINTKLDGDIVVSTDSEKIANVAKRYSNIIVVKRPKELSVDTASTESALIHALDYMKEYYGKEYDAVITLQPTSPLRKTETILKFIKNYEEHLYEYDAQLTLTESRADYWINSAEDGFRRLYPNAPRRRQEREPLYVENSCIYVTKVDTLRKTNIVLGLHANGFVIPEEEGIDINEPMDLKIAEAFIMNQRNEN